MSNIIKTKEKDKKNNKIYKAFSLSAKYNKQRLNRISLEIEQKNSSKRNILKNAGNEICNSQKFLTIDNNRNNSQISNSILSLDHKGIKRKGYNLYDPYLIQICKSAVFRERKDLPNYKDIIQKVNTEFGIQGEKYDKIDSYYKRLINRSSYYLKNKISSFNNSNKSLDYEKGEKK